MPLIDDPSATPSLLTPRGFIPLIGIEEEEKPTPPPKEEEGPGFLENLVSAPIDFIAGGAQLRSFVPNPTVEAAARQSNTVSSAIARAQDTWGVSNELVDPNYSPWLDVAGTKYEPYWKNTFSRSNNHQYTEALKRSIDRQEEDRRTVEAGGALGTAAGILAGAIDPTIFIPVGGQITLVGKGVWNVSRGALVGARTGALGAGVYELGLHGSQETRTVEESAINIGTGVVLGAVLGGTIASALSRTQMVASSEAVERLATLNVPGSAGAAAPHYFTLDDLTINGTITRNIAAATAYSPNLRGNFRESPLARRTYQEIATNTLRQGMHDSGLSLGPSVETNINVSLGETIGHALEAHPDFYIAGKKAGFGMSSEMFETAIGRAMRREDIGENEFVTNAAKMWRSQVIEPLAKQAVDLGLLPKDVSVTEAPSYFSRMYNVDRITANKPAFMTVVTDHFNGVLQEQYTKAVSSLQTKSADLAEEIANMRLSPEDRLRKLDELSASRESLEESFVNEAAIADEIKSLRAVERKARESGDTSAEAAAKARIERLKEEGGEEFRQFKTEEAKIKKATKQVNLSVGGLEEKAFAIQEQLTNLSANNFKSLKRLVARGQKLAKELKRKKNDPAQIAAQVEDLRGQFYALVTRSEQAQDRLAKQIQQMKEKAEKTITPIPTKEEFRTPKSFKELQVDPRVDSIDDARASGGGIFINLKEGFEWSGQRSFGTETVKEALSLMKSIDRMEQGSADNAITQRLEKALAAEASRNQRLNEISQRLEAAEALDPNLNLDELTNAVDELTLEISNKALGRGERAQALLARLAKLDPAKVDEHVTNLEQLQRDITRGFYDKWEIKRQADIDLTDPNNIPDFTVHAKDMAQEVYDSVTGNDYGSQSIDPQFHLAATTGPLKERTFHIPDEKIEPFLEDNVVKVMTRFARQMSAQIELARKFPDDPLLTNRFQNIKREYDELINAATTEAERTKLQKDMKGTFRDLRGLLEIHRGSYLAKENASNYGRVVRGTMNFNYIRSMGGAAIPSLADLYNPAVFHGFARTMQSGVPNLLKAISKQGNLVKEAKYAGVAERLSHHRLLTLAEIGDPYAQGTAIERMLDAGTHVASKWNGLNWLTDFEKAFDAIIVQDRLNTGIMQNKDTAWIAQSGMGPEMRERVKGYLQQYATDEDGIMVANTDQWDDFEAVRAYRAAINFNVNADVVTRGIGDVPLMAYSPTGKLLLQFKTFALSAHQRTMLRAMQLGPAQFLSGLIGLTTIGMFATTLRAWRGGEESWKRFENSAKNPGYMIGEGLDATGLFTLPLEVANVTERVSAPSGYAVNPIKTPIMLAGRSFVPDASVQGNTQRFAGRGPLSSLLGPSAGILEDTSVAAGGAIDAARGEEVSQSQLNAANRIVPYGSYIGMREMLQVMQDNSPYVDE